MEVFNNMWGRVKNVLAYREEKRRQPLRFWPEKLIVTAHDPPNKILYVCGGELRAQGTLDYRVLAGCGNCGSLASKLAS